MQAQNAHPVPGANRRSKSAHVSGLNSFVLYIRRLPFEYVRRTTASAPAPSNARCRPLQAEVRVRVVGSAPPPSALALEPSSCFHAAPRTSAGVRAPAPSPRRVSRNPRRLPRHELKPTGPLDPDDGVAQRHRTILATYCDLVHRRAGDDCGTAVRTRLRVAVRLHLA